MKIQLEQWEERNIHKFLNQHEQWFEGMSGKNKLDATALFFKQIKEYLALEHIIDNFRNFGLTSSYSKTIAEENLSYFRQFFGGTEDTGDDKIVDFYYGRIACSVFVDHDENGIYYIKLSPKFDLAWYGTDEWVTLNINEILCSY